MEIFKIKNLSFSYPKKNFCALDDINLEISRGDFVVIFGASGSGKTTLLRHLKPQIAPHGKKSGEILFEETPLEKLSTRDAAKKIGFVMQSPENQIVTDKVWHELSFGLENLGAKTNEIRLRTAEIANFFGIHEWFHKSVAELSGGQKQILALASVMAMQPSVLILDEPTSRLDPIAAGEFLSVLEKINRELGVTIILTEHRADEIFSLCSRAIVLENGRVFSQGTPAEIAANLQPAHAIFFAMPTPTRVWAACEKIGECPLTVRDGAKWLEKNFFHDEKKKFLGEKNFSCDEKKFSCDEKKNFCDEKKFSPSQPAIIFKNCYFKYEKNSRDVIKNLNFTTHFGETVAILGGNGTGKTTMLSLAAKIISPQRGKIISHATVCALPQDPQTLFTQTTVLEDLREVSRDESEIKNVINLCRLDGILESHPYDLSGGEQQRAAFAKILLLRPKILLLDEPTKGFDAEYKKFFAQILFDLKTAGAAILIVSHDIEFCAEHADRCALFFDGGIVTENTPRNFFAGNNFYTTAANRMARHFLPRAITAADIIRALGEREERTEKNFSRERAEDFFSR
ncbi:MAG: ATP-binding cassette domain-containing protein, partial [Defluviitaleaceae bacterium]|nr:ATP-binding cassette domain-containing protein [Defluviitaleaceae bacterium]